MHSAVFLRSDEVVWGNFFVKKKRVLIPENGKNHQFFDI